MSFNRHYQVVEFFSFKIKTTLNNELKKNLKWIYVHGEENKTSFTLTNFDIFAKKLRKSRKLLHTKINFAKTSFQEK